MAIKDMNKLRSLMHDVKNYAVNMYESMPILKKKLTEGEDIKAYLVLLDKNMKKMNEAWAELQKHIK